TLLQACAALGAAEAGILDAAPRRLPRAERPAAVVHPDHAGLEPARHPPAALEVARPDAGGKAEARRIGAADGVVLGAELLDRDDRAEDLLAGEPRRVGHALEQGRLLRRHTAREHAGAARDRVADQPGDPLSLRVRDERS